MSAALTLDNEFSEDLRIIQRAIRSSWKRPTKSSRFVELTRLVNKITDVAESCWDEIPSDIQALMADIAYSWADDPCESRNPVRRLWKRFRSAARVFYIILLGQQRELLAYCAALDHFSDVVFNAIERSDLVYQEAISQAIDDAFLGIESTKSMTAEEACDRIKQLSNQVLSEL